MLSRHRFDNAITAEDVEKLIAKNLCNKVDGGRQSRESERKREDKDRDCDGRGSGASSKIEQACSGKKEKIEEKNGKLMKIKHNMIFPGLLLIALMMMLRLTMQLAENREYMMMAVIIAFAIMIPFFWRFERRRPEAAEIVLISVMITLAVVSRVVFVIPNYQIGRASCRERV